MSLPQDILGVIRGLQIVIQAGAKLQESRWRTVWQNSSLRSAAEEYLNKPRKRSMVETDLNKNFNDLAKNLSDSSDRICTVCEGIKEYVSQSTLQHAPKVPAKSIVFSESVKPVEVIPHIPPHIKKGDLEIKLTPSDKKLLKKLDMEHSEKLRAAAGKTEAESIESKKIDDHVKGDMKQKEKTPKVKAVPNPKSKQALNSSAKERSVPSSRIARMASFGGLAAGLGVGTAAEFFKRTLGIGDFDPSSTMFLNQANMDRIVDTLCKVRGAALKIGQMLSIQDESTVTPELSRALERVRRSADFMPSWQLEQVMRSELGENWRDRLSYFEEKPFAAASIGEVHSGKTPDGKQVAIKVQYPGVAKSIESDIDNLIGLMKVWNMFPKGMFVDNVVTVAKRELAWEVDYTREAECTKKFKELLAPYQYYYVPEVIDNLCSGQVFTTECLEGIPVDQCTNLDLEDRKFIADKLMELCLRELIEFRYMQTDPNWANFLYNPRSKKLLLLDFGASREYPKPFVDKYVQIIKAASENDRDMVLKFSRDLGLLTGYESKIMEEAHVDAVMILGEVFQCRGEFMFKGNDTIARIQNLVPTMIAHRLCPPPEEIYSLHRKLSGIFLLCAKLNAPISSARSLFLDMYSNYQFH